MTCAEDFSGWASGILDNLDESGIAVGSVALWLQSNLGILNIALRTDYELNESGCVTGEMNSAESGIYTEMYYCHYYRRKANAALGAASYDWTEIVGEDQGSVKKVSKNEVAKTYRLLASEACGNVTKLTKWYHDVYNPNTPLQILCNSRMDVTRTALRCPPNSFYSVNNYVWVSYD